MTVVGSPCRCEAGSCGEQSLSNCSESIKSSETTAVLFKLRHYAINCLKQRAGVTHFRKWLRRIVCHHVYGRRVVDPYHHRLFPVGLYLRSKLALGIDCEWQSHLVLLREFFGIATKISGSDRYLVLVDVIAESGFQVVRLRGLAAEVMGQDRSLVRPVMLRQRKIVDDHRDFVVLLGFVHDGLRA